MASEHEEVDPIKSNPNSHKVIGVVMMVTILVGLSWCLAGRESGRESRGKAGFGAGCCESMEACPEDSENAPPDLSEPQSLKENRVQPEDLKLEK